MYNIKLIDKTKNKTSKTTPAQLVHFNVAQMRQVHFEGKLVYMYDIEDPVISSLNLKSEDKNNPQWITMDQIIVSGTVTDAESGVKSCKVNGINANIVGTKFDCPVSIPNTNLTKITIEAEDNIGHKTIITRYVHKDKDAPVITFDSWGMGKGLKNSPFFTVKANQAVTGKVTDTLSGVATLTVNGLTVPVNNDGTFRINNISLLPNTTTQITIYAKDKAGNTTDASMYAYADTSVKRLLQIYPGAGAGQMQQWLVNDGFGQGLISVGQCSLSEFNSNPNGYLKDSSGNYRYDVIFFGTWDSNNSQDLTASSAAAVRSYANTGRGVIVGHDTIRGGGACPNFCSLRDLFNLKCGGGVDYSEAWGPCSATVEITKDSFFTTYPNYIGGKGTRLTIPLAHTVYQVCREEERMLKFVGPFSSSYGDTPAYLTNAGWHGDYYLMCHNNCAMIQTGHSSGQATDDERKIIANLVIYLALKYKTKQITGETVE